MSGIWKNHISSRSHSHSYCCFRSMIREGLSKSSRSKNYCCCQRNLSFRIRHNQRVRLKWLSMSSRSHHHYWKILNCFHHSHTVLLKYRPFEPPYFFLMVYTMHIKIMCEKNNIFLDFLCNHCNNVKSSCVTDGYVGEPTGSAAYYKPTVWATVMGYPGGFLFRRKNRRSHYANEIIIKGTFFYIISR